MCCIIIIKLRLFQTEKLRFFMSDVIFLKVKVLQWLCLFFFLVLRMENSKWTDLHSLSNHPQGVLCGYLDRQWKSRKTIFYCLCTFEVLLAISFIVERFPQLCLHTANMWICTVGDRERVRGTSANWFCLGSRFLYMLLIFARLCGNCVVQVPQLDLSAFLQVDSITSLLRGTVVARAFEQTKCFTPGRGLQGKTPGPCRHLLVEPVKQKNRILFHAVYVTMSHCLVQWYDFAVSVYADASLGLAGLLSGTRRRKIILEKLPSWISTTLRENRTCDENDAVACA